MLNADFKYRLVTPDNALSDFVYCFSALQNVSRIDDGIIIPNGKVDLFFSLTDDHQFHIGLMGLETQPKPARIQFTSFFAINFNPLAIEYIFQQPIAGILNSGKELPNDFWGFSMDDLSDFDGFCEKATRKIQSLLPGVIDERKRKLFELIFTSNGEMSVKELSEKICWGERQINRYFKQQFGLSLKSYCNILRFQASLPYIKQGELYPQLNFTDQSHFIKAVKKLSGESPKELHKNENDRFLQFLMPDRE